MEELEEAYQDEKADRDIIDRFYKPAVNNGEFNNLIIRHLILEK